MALIGNNASNALGQVFGGMGQVASNTVTTTGAQNWAGAYPQYYPTASPQIVSYQQHVPVIRHDHPEPIHFVDKNGHVHSWDVGTLFKTLGLDW